ncbi:MAG: TIGR03013 family XrtA/PEP-CTERM system glycosyltransferase [Nitrospiria bacterium]
MKIVLKQFINVRSALFFITEGFLIFSSVGFAIALRFLFDKHLILQDPLIFFKASIFAGVCQVCFAYSDLYSFKNGRYNQELIKRLVQSILIAAVLLTILSYLFPALLIGRGIFITSLIICPLLVISWRRLYNRILDKSLSNNRLIIVGSGGLALEIGREILSNKSLGYQMAGFIDESSKGNSGRTLNPSIIGDHEQLLGIARKEKVNHIIVALSERRKTLPLEQLWECKMLGVEIEDGHSFYEKMTGRVSLEELKLSWLIYSDGFQIYKSKRILKRTMDIIFSLIGIAAAAPFFILIPLLIRIDSPGPVFYRQERVGEKGKNFTLLKFRSMRHDAEDQLGPVWAKTDDPRATRLGGLMRKARIDEIPQLINVLKGEMSFVGPRPERPVFVDQFIQEIPYYKLRNSVKPGITGWAQVKFHYGASKEDTCQKLQYDLYYIKNLSIFLDLAIIFSTIRVVLSGRGAR